MVSDKVYKIFSFKESQWLKNYFDYNCKKWTEAENDFQTDF